MPPRRCGLGRGRLEQRRHALVGMQHRGRQVPRLPVGLVAQRRCQLSMRGRAHRKRHRMVDGRADERVAEPEPGLVDRDQAKTFGGRQGLGVAFENASRRRSQIGAVGHRGHQQRRPRRCWQRVEPGGDGRRQPVAGRQRLGRPSAAGGGIFCDDPRQLDQRHGISGCLGDHQTSGPASGRAGLLVEQRARVRRRQRPEPQLGDTLVKAGRRRVALRAEQQDDPVSVQPGADEGQHVKGAAVDPVGVIDDRQHRSGFRHVGQQGKRGYPGHQPVGGGGLRGQAERSEQRLRLVLRKARRGVEHRAQELMKAREGEARLRLPAGGRQHLHASGPGPLGRVRQQRGLAHARIAEHHQHPAVPAGRIHEGREPREFGFAAHDDPGGTGRLVRHLFAIPVPKCSHASDTPPRAAAR